jgi:uncharacterized protein YdeI (YjbR/CyaY-like superfamily)
MEPHRPRGGHPRSERPPSPFTPARLPAAAQAAKMARMVSVTPPPGSIHAFPSESAFEKWVAANHDKKTEIYLRIFKKGSGTPTVTYAQALDVALCWGWIDGIKKSFDDKSFLQRFTPRRAKSVWSQINRDHVARLVAAGRMTPHGLAHVTAAKADGRWAAAYASGRTMTVPDDLTAALKAQPRAWATFRTLNKQNLYALAFRLSNLKTPGGRAKRVAAFVDMLKVGKTPWPNGKIAAARKSVN